MNVKVLVLLLAVCILGVANWAPCQEAAVAAPEATAEAAPTETPRTFLAAVFVKNRAGDEFNDKILPLEDLVTARIADLGFRTMSREDVVKAIASFEPQEKKPDATQPPVEEDLDRHMATHSSALRLAQAMGADYMMVVTLTQVRKSDKNYTGYGVATKATTHELVASYKLLDGVMGGSLTGGTVTAKSVVRQSEGLQESGDVIDTLLDDAAGKLAKQIQKKVEENKIAKLPEKPAMVSFTVQCGMQDLNIPDIVKDDKGEYVVSANKYRLEPLSVTVELDGAAIGSTPGPFTVMPGLHQIRLSREGFKDWERHVNIHDGQVLNVSLQMNEEGYARFIANCKFLEDLKSEKKLTDAEIKRIEGIAEMFRNSGFRVDISEDVKVDTKEPVNVNVKKQSFWD